MRDEAGVLRPGLRLGPYDVRERIGRGGMGDVYRAHDTALNRDVALKVLTERFLDDSDRLARFQREAQILAALNHPNIGAIYGVERTEAGHPVLILELVEGINLSDRIRHGLQFAEALSIARQIALALEAAHSRGIVHRDLKPDNIRIRPDGALKVFDFGLATGPAPGSPQTDVTTKTGWPPLTLPGVVLGTAAYVSPQQACGDEIDQRADIWAFGVILFEMLAGRRPFSGDSIAEVLAAVLQREPDLDLLPPTTTPSVRRLIRRCLQKEVSERLHHIADARLEIDDSLREHGEAAVPLTPSDVQLSRRPLTRTIFAPFLGVTRVAAAALLVPVTFAGAGFVTSFVFNQALRAPSTEGFFDFFRWGYRAVVPPAILLILGGLGLTALLAALALLVWLARRLWPKSQLLDIGRRVARTTGRWLAGRDVRSVGRAFLVLSCAALVAFVIASWRLLWVIAQMIAYGPAAGVDTSVLSPSDRPYVLLVSQLGTVLLFALLTIWIALFPWLLQRSKDHWVVRMYRRRSLGAILALLLLLAAPWRIVWNNARERVVFDGRFAFVLSEGPSRVVIYVPGQTPVEVASDDDRLVRPNRGRLDSIFPD